MLSSPRVVSAAETAGRVDRSTIRLEQVTVHIRGTLILKEVSLIAEAGERIGLTGPNGAGKSTLLRVLATLLAPSSGVCRVLGADSRSPERFRVRPRIAFLGHEPALHPALSLAENLTFVARLRDAAPQRVQEVLEAVGLQAAQRRRVADCSKGMLRRAEIARAFLVEPELLLLDEAHAGLDPSSEHLVDTLVASVRSRGGTAVVVSHELQRLHPLVDRVVELVAGRLRGRPR